MNTAHNLFWIVFNTHLPNQGPLWLDTHARCCSRTGRDGHLAIGTPVLVAEDWRARSERTPRSSYTIWLSTGWILRNHSVEGQEIWGERESVEFREREVEWANLLIQRFKPHRTQENSPFRYRIRHFQMSYHSWTGNRWCGRIEGATSAQQIQSVVWDVVDVRILRIGAIVWQQRSFRFGYDAWVRKKSVSCGTKVIIWKSKIKVP